MFYKTLINGWPTILKIIVSKINLMNVHYLLLISKVYKITFNVYKNDLILEFIYLFISLYIFFDFMKSYY